MPSVHVPCGLVRTSTLTPPPFAPLSYNYVAPAVGADSTGVVVKACFPDHRFLAEAEALRRFAGHGATRLLEADPRPRRAAAGALTARHTVEPGGGRRGAYVHAALIASQAEQVLLHGDLHHDNVLAAGRQPWLAIDPKGVVGEPAYETGALLQNPAKLLDETWPERILVRRVDQLAEELGFDRERVRGWGLA